jgi:tripartite-type tricarboxylate transporter receptor subunit TctC
MMTAVKTPLETRVALATAIGEALQDAIVRERFAALLLDIKFLGPNEFAEEVRTSKTFFTSLVERLQLTPT